MSDHNQPNNRSIDELLAAYTDQVQAAEDPSAIPLSEDKEIRQLQETVLQLHQAAPSSPSRAKAQQLKPAVLEAWQAQCQPKPKMLQRLQQMFAPPEKSGYQSISRRRQQTALRLTAAAALVIIAAFVILPSVGISGGTTSGTAAGDLGWWPLIAGVLFLGGYGVWWWLSRNK